MGERSFSWVCSCSPVPASPPQTIRRVMLLAPVPGATEVGGCCLECRPLFPHETLLSLNKTSRQVGLGDAQPGFCASDFTVKLRPCFPGARFAFGSLTLRGYG